MINSFLLSLQMDSTKNDNEFVKRWYQTATSLKKNIKYMLIQRSYSFRQVARS